jgi:glucokinase
MILRLLALDFGGTKLAAARIDVKEPDAELVAVERALTPENASTSREVMWELADRAAKGATVDAVGVGFGGPVDTPRGIVRTSFYVPGWDDYPLAAETSKQYGVPSIVLNDANAGALGEQRWGAGRGVSDVLYVTVSTGIGAGLVLGGRLHTGAHGLSGELGHLLISEDGPLCACGRRGCLEAIASGTAIARAAREELDARCGQGALLRASADAHGLDARVVGEAARQGDEIAVAVLAQAGHALGIGLAAVVSLCDPAAIVLGGSVVESGEPLLGPARAALLGRVFGEPPRLRTSALGAEAPLFGAAAAAADLLAEPTR